MLQNKNAIIYGAGGSIGRTVANAFAIAGATVYLSGRNLAPVQQLADEIIASGGKAFAEKVDAMDEIAVNNYVANLVRQGVVVNVSFNLIDLKVVQGLPLVDMAMLDFVRPTNIAMQSHFITDIAAAKVMIKQGSGVILSLTATPGGIGYPFTAGFAPACCAIEGFACNLASEIGKYGVRVVNLRSGGSPDSKVFADAIAANPAEMKVVLNKMEADSMLKKLPKMADVANTAVFLASDLAAAITGVTVDVTCGTTTGLNYRSNGNAF